MGVNECWRKGGNVSLWERGGKAVRVSEAVREGGRESGSEWE